MTKEINNNFQLLEYERKTKIKKINILKIISVLILITSNLMVSFSQSSAFMLVAIFILLIGTAILLFSVKLTRDLLNVIKDEYVRFLIENSGYEDVEYNVVSSLKKESIKERNFLKRPDRFTSSDEIKGKMNGNNFYFSNIHLEDLYTDGNGNSRYITYFKGQWIEIELPFSIEGKVELLEKRGVTFKTEKTLEKFSNESIEFNKKFNSFSSDQRKYYKLMTFKKIENLTELEKIVDGHFSIFYEDSKLTVLLNTKRFFFDPKLNKPLTEKENQEKIKLEIEILKLINELAAE